MELFANLVAWLVLHRIIVLVAVVLGISAFLVINGMRKKRVGGGSGCAMFAFFMFVMGLTLFGSSLSTALIARYGEEGRGIVTGKFATGSLYNEEPVVGFNVLLRKADGTMVKTSFRTDSFNIYPSKNSVRYPGVGAEFNAKYLPANPDAFIIIDNDDSPWAKSLKCGDLLRAVASAQQQKNFAGDDPAFQRELDEATNKVIDAGCMGDMAIPSTNP